LNRVFRAILNIALGFMGGFCLIYLGMIVAEFLAEGAGIAIVFALPLLFLILVLPFLALAPLFLASAIRGSPGMVVGAVAALALVIFQHHSDVEQQNNLADDIIARHPQLESRAFAPPSRPLDMVEFSGAGCGDDCQRVLLAPQFKAVIMQSGARWRRVYSKVTGDACLAPELVESLLEFAENGYGFACAQLMEPTPDGDLDALIVLSGNADAMQYAGSPELARYFSGSQAGLVERINGGTRLLGHWFSGEIKSKRENWILDLTLGRPDTKRVGESFTESEFLEAALNIPPKDVAATPDSRLDQSLSVLERAMTQPEVAEKAERALFNLLGRLRGARGEVVERHLKAGYSYSLLLKALDRYRPPDLAPYEAPLSRALQSGSPQEIDIVLHLIQDRASGAGLFRKDLVTLALSDKAANHAKRLRRIFAVGMIPVEVESRDAAREKLTSTDNLDAMQAMMLLALASGHDREKLNEILATLPLVTYEQILGEIDIYNSDARGWRMVSASFDPEWTPAEIDLMLKHLPQISAQNYAKIERLVTNYSFGAERPELRDQLKAIAAARSGSTPE
jgi:hypothetical protein